MADEEKALEKLLEYGHLDQDNTKAEGIAKRAMSHGFDSLSQPQKAVLSKFLARECEGVTDPGGYHNGCEVQLEGESLAEALTRESYGDGFICESCDDESNEYKRQWERIEAE
ncbi:hypothetical protein LU688_11345 [Pseudomonas soli]|uniref:hypothetical protein n=1 Tax=Pseudomonas soli TaxID=1306993 RepID=UPI001E6583FA|nr:hypothetical protein [Pseudomonas soli]WJO24130.1 hypothetical protein LU688_11345 [Pseudomonas soli]